jgi:hypothetical protein
MFTPPPQCTATYPVKNITIETKRKNTNTRLKKTTNCFQNKTRSFFHSKVKYIVLQYKQELQNMNNEKPV